MLSPRKTRCCHLAFCFGKALEEGEGVITKSHESLRLQTGNKNQVGPKLIKSQEEEEKKNLQMALAFRICESF